MKKIHLIFLSVFFSFLISFFLVNNIFLDQTPKLKPDLLTAIKIIKPKNEIESPSVNFSSFTVKTPKKIEEMIQTTSLKKIAKGIYAGETENKVKIYSYNISEIEWQIVEYTLKNGKKVKIKVPKGLTPPEKEEIEIVFK